VLFRQIPVFDDRSVPVAMPSFKTGAPKGAREDAMSNRAASFAALVAIVAIAVGSAGCLVKETTGALCLEPDGAVRWTVIERNIHATGDTPADRQREEDEFMALVAADQHPNAVAFRALGGSDVRTEVVSARWPFAVLTEARFPDVAGLLQQLFDRVGEIRGQSVLERSGSRTTWKITVDYDPDAEQPGADNGDELPTSLLSGDPPVFFMRHGQFVDAVGFEISDDGRVAKPKDLSDRDWDKEPRLVLSLTWVAAEAVTSRSPR
jgi:hypothetical protein